MSIGRLLLSPVLALSVLAPLAAPTPWWFLPADLRVVGVLLSPAGANHVRTYVANEGSLDSAPCWARVTVHSTPPVTSFHMVPALLAGEWYGLDFDTGTSPSASPGLVTTVHVDAFHQIAELDESDNLGWFIAPAW
jgi:hypothetical protein